MPKRKTTEEFIRDAINVHGSFYDYSLVDYINSSTPVIIICPIHGPFKQTPNIHLKGCDCPKHFDDKRKATKFSRYGDKNYRNEEKRKATNKAKYGHENPFANSEIKNKIKNTILEKYGVEHPAQNKSIHDKMTNTNLSRYGVENPFQSPSIKEKIFNTNMERYGVKNPSQSTEIQEKIKNTCIERYGGPAPACSETVKKKIIDKWIDNYGENHPFKNKDVLSKVYQTKKNNNTFNSSKPEDELETALTAKFNKVCRNYAEDPRYPFACDFYIPERELFIEYNGFWTHQPSIGWYNQKSSKHRKLREELDVKFPDWIPMSWYTSDVKKRKAAKKHNLNYVVLWNEQDIEDWFALGCPDGHDGDGMYTWKSKEKEK